MLFHGHAGSHGHAHDHTHGHVEIASDSAILSSRKGIQAVKLSFAGLIVTALLQLVVVYFTGSVALLADTIHNIGDAATAIPLWVAFTLAQRPPSRRFTYGYGRVEDLAGVAIVLIILFSAVVAAWQAVDRLLHPQKIEHLWAVAVASLVGFAGNELVAQFRMRTGREIGSAALVADGYHARVDGLTSLAVFAGAVGVWFGLPLADPVVGIVISAVILRIVLRSAKDVFSRMLDGVDPGVVEEVRHAAGHVAGIREVSEVRVRWLGHRLHAEVNIAVAPSLPVSEAHAMAKEVRHQLIHHLKYLSTVTVHVDPSDASGEKFHSIDEHAHGGLPLHSHRG